MECTDRSISRRWWKQSGHQQVHRIPDPVPAHQSVHRGQNGHCHAASETTLDAGRDRIGLQRQPSAGDLPKAADSLDSFTGRCNSDFLLNDGDRLVRFDRQHLAEPPDRTCHGQDRAQNAHRSGGDHSGGYQRQSESEHDRPRRRRGHFDIV